MYGNLVGRRLSDNEMVCPEVDRNMIVDTLECGSARNRSARPSSSRISSVEG